MGSHSVDQVDLLPPSENAKIFICRVYWPGEDRIQVSIDYEDDVLTDDCGSFAFQSDVTYLICPSSHRDVNKPIIVNCGSST